VSKRRSALGPRADYSEVWGWFVEGNWLFLRDGKKKLKGMTKRAAGKEERYLDGNLASGVLIGSGIYTEAEILFSIGRKTRRNKNCAW
jgi:hypothetical protein